MYSTLFLEAGYEAKTPLREAGRPKCCFFSEFAVTWAALRLSPLPSSSLAVSVNDVWGLVQHKSHAAFSIFRAVLLRSGAS